MISPLELVLLAARLVNQNQSRLLLPAVAIENADNLLLDKQPINPAKKSKSEKLLKSKKTRHRFQREWRHRIKHKGVNHENLESPKKNRGNPREDRKD